MTALANTEAEPTPSMVIAKILPKILLVEDEEIIASSILLALTEEGYEVVIAPDGQQALEQLLINHTLSAGNILTNGFSSSTRQHNFDLIILDIMLPLINGLDICRTLRRQGDITPILILSARNSETDRVLGLEVGADDYLTKPFGIRELIARCRVLLRRPKLQAIDLETTLLRFQDLTLDAQEHRVFLRNKEIFLPPKEFKLLETLIRSPKQVFSREQLLQKIWGVEYTGETKTVDVHMRWLREKLERDPSRPEYLITVRGFGYRLG